jgi:hypothetical protein
VPVVPVQVDPRRERVIRHRRRATTGAPPRRDVGVPPVTAEPVAVVLPPVDQLQVAPTTVRWQAARPPSVP